MVDILIHHCRYTMCGLNPYIFPFIPNYQGDKQGRKVNNVTSKKKPYNEQKKLKKTKVMNSTKKQNNKT